MSLDETAWLAALRDSRPIDDIVRALGLTTAEFAEARDRWLGARQAPADRQLAGAVSGRIAIKRDRAGVPHVFAATTPDLYYGLGVAMAEDRLWQMDRLRRRALGRQAEILGPPHVASDLAHLTVGIDLIAARDAAAMDGATRAVVESLVAGINRQIAAFGRELPIEFRLLDYEPAPFTVADVVAIARGIWWSLNGRIDRLAAAEAARMLPTEDLRQRYLTPEGSENLVCPEAGPGRLSAGSHPAGTDDATGSNNWALAGGRTPEGLPILCGDPHQPFWVPSSWYEFGLHGPEDQCAGAGHPGLPGLWWGSNGTAAWAITNNMASTRDLYREVVDPGRPGFYREGDAWRAFEERAVTIPVRGAAAQAAVVRSTLRGPIVNRLLTAVTEGGDPPLALRWVGAERLDDLRAMIGVGRARDWPAFRAALQDWAVAVFNFVYADRSGNIGYQMAGRVPLRGRVTPGFRDAGNPLDHWAGTIPFEGLPHSFNPARGYVASANQRIVGPDYPFPIYGAYSQGHRGRRIDDQMAEAPRMDRSANIGLQNDVKNLRAVRLVPPILAHLAEDADPEAGEIVAALSGWDGRYDRASRGPTVFETFMAIWQRRVQALHLPERLLDLTVQQTGLGVSVLDGSCADYFPAGTRAMVRAVAKEAVQRLRDRLGPDPAAWAWERVHIAHWRHPLSTPASAGAFDIGPAPVDGGSHTIRNTGGELPPHQAGSGAEYRMVVDFAQPDRFLAVQNIGNSGVPGSPHYRDQFQPWLDGDYHVIRLDAGSIDAATVATTVIVAA